VTRFGQLAALAVNARLLETDEILRKNLQHFYEPLSFLLLLLAYYLDIKLDIPPVVIDEIL